MSVSARLHDVTSQNSHLQVHKYQIKFTQMEVL